MAGIVTRIKRALAGRCGKCGAQKQTDSFGGIFVSSFCPYCERGPDPAVHPDQAHLSFREIDEQAGRERDLKIFPLQGNGSNFTWAMRTPGEGTAARFSSSGRAARFLPDQPAERHDPLAEIAAILQGRQR
jgi:hypothetical protein